MIGKFDIQVNLNGWLIPFHVESKGEGIFKVAYESVNIGHLLVNDTSKWMYLTDISDEKLLNSYTADKISKAIINY
ncbi:hypothetical protein SAMN06265348_103366 [Pedobacter westerhofensis]|uniref:Uncharacterized protein n=1 Tax=Pedobacter westerhofensis TaxID=425512 RepID=A0A521CA24_9SPHI|nr:hypothetical protein [Pedobacter westerhofensis]SMO56322.1 hypothetical protein SAMN06265348_103366 [Pedobacter westerhofensis]